MTFYETRKDAIKNCSSDETFWKVSGGYYVGTYGEWLVWQGQM